MAKSSGILGAIIAPKARNVVGSTQLYDDGQMRYIPAPTADPKDPLNLPEWRKWVAIAALSFFGGLALSSETVLGALVPIFVLEYAGMDPKMVGMLDLSTLLPPGEVELNPMRLMAGLGGPPIKKTSLISSLPLLVNGLASYFLIPLSIAYGRRPVLLFSGALAWIGGLWAGCSTSLDSHLAARAMQGFGVGAVEALIPLIIQDMVFIHRRNTAFSLVGASQGLIVIGLGINAPRIVLRLSWRFLYYFTAGAGVVSWISLILLVPETRHFRTRAELAGQGRTPLEAGESRARLDPGRYGERTLWTDLGIFNVKTERQLALWSVWETAKSTVFPNVIWIILLQSAFTAAVTATTQTASSVLIAAGWRFEDMGLVVVPAVCATPFVWLFGGFLADRISNWQARRNGGRREPEAHLISLLIPFVAGAAGPLIYAYSATHVRTLPPSALLAGIFLLTFGGVTTNTLVSVYLVESYPNFAGPVLVTVSSLRLIVGFAISFDAVQWIQDAGFMPSFAIYSGIMVALSLLLPVMYIYGKKIRAWTERHLDLQHHHHHPEADDGAGASAAAAADGRAAAAGAGLDPPSTCQIELAEKPLLREISTSSSNTGRSDEHHARDPIPSPIPVPGAGEGREGPRSAPAPAPASVPRPRPAWKGRRV